MNIANDFEHEGLKLTEKEFETLFKELYPDLCGFTNRTLQNLPEAEEIVQDVFVNLWINKSNITLKNSLKAYLFQMAHNAAINKLDHLRTRKNKVNKTVSENEWLAIHLSYSVDDSMLQVLEVQETEKQILKLLQELPEKCREIFLLSRYQNLSNVEISKKLNISPSTVRVQIFSALNHLKKIFLHYILSF